MSRTASGFLVIISAPSGTGKSTVCKKLLKRDSSLRYSISCTTRPPRAGEVDGRHYFFLTKPEFKRRARQDEMLETARVHGNFYGTPRHYIERQTRAGHTVILAIDVQGAASIKRKRPDVVTVFLLPPSRKSLTERLRGRHDSSHSIRTRLANAAEELRRAKEYDYWVVNDSLMTAVAQVEAIIAAEKLRPRHFARSETSAVAQWIQ